MLKRIDLSQRLSRQDYRPRLLEQQIRLRLLALELYQRQRSVVIVYEGWDAAGKGGNIRRVTEKLDPRGYQVWQIAAPEGEDKSHHYLWRFWRRLLPADEKQIVIFDRSWYGRVMVERVEGFATEDEWRRAFREINEFERQLVDGGILVVKFFVHISREEQLSRFQTREKTAYKQWKLTDEDWRNRSRWDQYEEAIEEMLYRTSTSTAPWKVIAGNSKRYARVEATEYLATVIDSFLGLDTAPPQRDSAPEPDGPPEPNSPPELDAPPELDSD